MPGGRDNARTPMLWDASPHAGFTTGTPWLPANPNHVEINAAAARADEDSVFHHYRRLIALRRSEPVVALGDFTMLLHDDEQVYAFTRRHGDVELLVAANLSSVPASGAAELLAGWSHAQALVPNLPGGVASDGILRPWEGVVLRRRVG